MSLHKSKGLTARVVVIAWMVEGLIPKAPKASYEPLEVTYHNEEQRRVAYVGLTRATQELVLSRFDWTAPKDRYKSQAMTGEWSQGGYRVLASTYLSEMGPALPVAIRGTTWTY